MPSGTRILGRRTVKGCVSETRGAQVACGKPILRWGVGRRGGGPPPAERRQRLLPPKPLSVVHFGCAVILRSGGAKTACRPRTGRPGPPADRQNTTESAHATAIPRYYQRFRGPGRRIPVSVANFENGISEYTGNHRPGRGSGRQIPVSVANWQNCISGYAVNFRPGRHP